MAWRLYWRSATSQRVRVALVTVLAPSNAARGILPGSPLAPPNAKFAISVAAKQPQYLRAVVYFKPSDAVSSSAQASIAGFPEFREAP